MNGYEVAPWAAIVVIVLSVWRALSGLYSDEWWQSFTQSGRRAVRLTDRQLTAVAHPSVREAARQLGVSVNTYQKARRLYQQASVAGPHDLAANRRTIGAFVGGTKLTKERTISQPSAVVTCLSSLSFAVVASSTPTPSRPGASWVAGLPRGASATRRTVYGRNRRDSKNLQLKIVERTVVAPSRSRARALARAETVVIRLTTVLFDHR
jgi:hypothetical protein